MRIILVITVLFMLICGCAPSSTDELQAFPAGYIDSPYVVPDGSALYFLHAVYSTIDMLTGNPKAQPLAYHLPNHQGQEGGYAWNTDLYVSYKNPDGTWGQPQNLGTPINTHHLECCAWVNDDQTVLIFTRESVTSDPTASGSFISRRDNRDDPWSTPERLPGELGDYGTTGFSDFRLTPGGNLYFESYLPGETDLFWAKSIGPNRWSNAERLPDAFQSSLNDMQPWVNDAETSLCFIRMGDDANGQLLCSTRPATSSAWSTPTEVRVKGFADGNGSATWGEPSFLHDGTMVFVRFNTATQDWRAELFMATPNSDGSYGPPQELIFKF